VTQFWVCSLFLCVESPFWRYRRINIVIYKKKKKKKKKKPITNQTT
jgi:hypothetical protein